MQRSAAFGRVGPTNHTSRTTFVIGKGKKAPVGEYFEWVSAESETPHCNIAREGTPRISSRSSDDAIQRADQIVSARGEIEVT